MRSSACLFSLLPFLFGTAPPLSPLCRFLLVTHLALALAVRPANFRTEESTIRGPCDSGGLFSREPSDPFEAVVKLTDSNELKDSDRSVE
jgi:hypothetical protein